MDYLLSTISTLLMIYLSIKLCLKGSYTYLFFIICIMAPFIPVMIFTFTNIWIFPDYTYWTNILFDEDNPLKVYNHLSLIYFATSFGLIFPFINLGKLYKKGKLSLDFRKVDFNYFNKKDFSYLFNINLSSQYILILTGLMMGIITVKLGFSSETILNQSYEDVLSSESYMKINTYAHVLLFYLQSTLIYLICLFGFSKNQKSAVLFKKIIILIAFLWIIFVDLSQGDRTSFGFVISLLLLFLYFNKLSRSNHALSLNPKFVFSLFLTIILLAYILGVIRVISISYFIDNPLQLLRLVGSYAINALPSNAGFRQLVGQAIQIKENNPEILQITINLIIYILPSFIRSFIGFNLPNDAFDTSLYSEFKSGGSNLATLPFEIGGYFAVFLTFLIFGYLIKKVEENIVLSKSNFPLTLAILFISYVPRITWYSYAYLGKFLSIILPFYIFNKILIRRKKLNIFDKDQKPQ